MVVDKQFRYRYGLSFRGVIAKHPQKQAGVVSRLVHQLQGSAAIDFRQKYAKPVAEQLTRACGGDQSKVLYDMYYEAEFSTPGLNEKLPPLYKECELIIVFLCKDYANRDWCLGEWEVIQGIARNVSTSHRVMYLWHGPMDEEATTKLNLPRQSDGTMCDGFMHIDNKHPEEISASIIRLYEKNRESPLVALHRDATISPMRSESWAGDGYRLRLMVEAQAKCGTQPLSQQQFKVYACLFSPKGDLMPHENEDDSFEDFSLEELAKKIVALDSAARIYANHHARNLNKANSETQNNGSSRHLVVSLALPAELIKSPLLYKLLRIIRQCCKSNDEQPDLEPPAIVLACAERILARALVVSQGNSPLSQWHPSASRAQEIAHAIHGGGNANASQLKSLSWRAFYDHGNGDESQEKSLMPQYFHFKQGEVFAGGSLETTPLSPSYGDEGFYTPQALYLSWSEHLPQEQADNYGKRMLRILYSGTPLFLIDRPSLLETKESPAMADSAPPKQDHPFDSLLHWRHAELITQFCHLHRMAQPPTDEARAMLWGYLRNSLVFWEDDRCDYIPNGRSKSVMNPASMVPPMH